jgi:hypothetical protein
MTSDGGHEDYRGELNRRCVPWRHNSSTTLPMSCSMRSSRAP